MAKSGMYVGLDIGTSSVKVVVAEYVEGQMNIIGVGDAKSEGLSRGIIIDIDETVKSIQNAVKQAEAKSGVEITEVAVGLPANLLEVEHCEGMIAVNSESKEITDDDVKNVAAASMVRSIPPERQIVSLVPQSFKVDTFDGIKDPRGMVGVRLEMKGLLFTGPNTIVHNIKTCVRKAGLKINKLVISALALTETILPSGEKNFGTTVIDLGAGQTTAAVMYEDELKFTHVEQEGGEFVTKDISVVLNTSLANAEGLKNNYGNAYSPNVSDNEEFPVDVIGQSNPVMVDEHYLSEIIEARMEQIFSKIKRVLGEIDALSLSGGIVLTGGAASVPGIVDLAEEVFEINHEIRLYVPNHMGLRNPMFSTVLAIIEYAASLSEIDLLVESAVTGEDIQIGTSMAKQGASSKKATVVSDDNDHYYDDDDNDHDRDDDEYEDEEEHDKEKATDRVRGFFGKIFE